jgi:hypothetical protein
VEGGDAGKVEYVHAVFDRHLRTHSPQVRIWHHYINPGIKEVLKSCILRKDIPVSNNAAPDPEKNVFIALAIENGEHMP